MRKCYRETLLIIPWFTFIVAWNYYWPEALPIEDVIASTCLFFFNRSFTRRFSF
jgi:hypothetical protein